MIQEFTSEDYQKKIVKQMLTLIWSEINISESSLF
jgi:hypothetical protein